MIVFSYSFGGMLTIMIDWLAVNVTKLFIACYFSLFLLIISFRSIEGCCGVVESRKLQNDMQNSHV